MPARLIHVDDSPPGSSREHWQDGGRYRDAKCRIIRDRDEITRLDAIALPPAYQDAWFCPAANGHILATGYDARGRKQYRYHPDFRLAQDADKYDRCAAFGHALPLLRARLERSEEHSSELQSLMRISNAFFCFKKKTHNETKYKK